MKLLLFLPKVLEVLNSKNQLDTISLMVVTLCHNNLLLKSFRLGISGLLLESLKTYLTDRVHRIPLIFFYFWLFIGQFLCASGQQHIRSSVLCYS